MADNENTRAPAGGSECSICRREGRLVCFGHQAASAPASAPLPLTDQRILDLVTENAEGSGWLSKPGCWGALNRFARAIERECLAAAPVADEPCADCIYVVFAENGNIRYWSRNEQKAREAAQEAKRPLVRLIESPEVKP